MVKQYERDMCALQAWVIGLTVMQQSVLISGVRGPDGIRKDHPVKIFMRWYRRCILLSAFDRRCLVDPIEPGGGSFTGPLPITPGAEISKPIWDDCAPTAYNERRQAEWLERARIEALTSAKEGVFRAIDELPHHFWLHLVHCAEIVGYKHPGSDTRAYFLDLYTRACQDMHMTPETEAEMDLRLSDNEESWRAREATPAR